MLTDITKINNSLVTNGWSKSPQNSLLWNNPIDNTLHTIKYAYNLQFIYNIIDKHNLYYKVYRNPYGFGYDLRFMTNKTTRKFFVSKINRPSLYDAQKIAENFNKGIKDEMSQPYHYNYNKIFIFNDIPTKRYFKVKDLHDLGNLAIQIINERDQLGQGFWYDFNLANPTPPALSMNEVTKINSPALIASTQLEWEKFYKDLTAFNKQNKLEKMFKTIKESQCPRTAIKFLFAFKDDQFDSFTVIPNDGTYNENIFEKII